MPYVQRIGGAIVAVFTWPQPQLDGTFLNDPDPVADDDPELLAFLNRPSPNPITAAQVLVASERDKDLAMQMVRAGDLVGALQLLGVLPKE